VPSPPPVISPVRPTFCAVVARAEVQAHRNQSRPILRTKRHHVASSRHLDGWCSLPGGEVHLPATEWSETVPGPKSRTASRNRSGRSGVTRRRGKMRSDLGDAQAVNYWTRTYRSSNSVPGFRTSVPPCTWNGVSTMACESVARGPISSCFSTNLNLFPTTLHSPLDKK
jgi:hypothetical protein